MQTFDIEEKHPELNLTNFYSAFWYINDLFDKIKEPDDEVASI